MAPKNLDKDCTPVTVDMLKQRLISPHVVDKYRNKPIPGNVAPMHNIKQGYCNTYLPQTSGFDRLLYVVQSFIAQGMYVVLDYQPMGLEQHAYDAAVFVETWASLWKQVCNTERVRLKQALLFCWKMSCFTTPVLAAPSC